MPMRVSDVITNVTKQNMNVMSSRLSETKQKERQNKKFWQIKIILIPKCSLHSNQENAYQHLLV